jgi:hypothetical protein
MNETELLALYRETAALRQQLAEAEIREMALKDQIEGALDYIYRQGDTSLTRGQVDEIICRLNGE